MFPPVKARGSARPASAQTITRLLVGFLLLIAGGVAHAQNPPPLPAPPKIGPSDNPALPSGMDVFTPPVSAQTVPADAPIFGEISRIIAPDQTIIAYGTQFAPASSGGKYVVYGQTTTTDGKLSDATLTDLTDGSRALIQMPKTFPSGAYLIWAKNAAGYSAPALMNGTEAWWVGPDVAMSGDTVSVYGRNLQQRGPRKASWVYIKPTTGAGRWASVTLSGPYRVNFTVPNLSPGDYEIWAHNGNGGAYGWSGPLRLTVQAKQTWNGPTFNVVNFGATPNSGNDDEAAIQAAIDAAAQKPNSTVYLPAGTFYAGRGFAIPSNVRLLGAGKDVTRLAVHPNFTTPPDYDGRRYSLIFQGGTHIAVSDITLDAAGNLNGYLQTLIYQRFMYDVRYDRVRIDARGYSGLDMHGSEQVKFNNCEIIANDNFMGSIRQAFFTGCQFKGTYDANQMIAFFGGDREIAFVKCVASDLDNSDPNNPAGWAQGRFVVFQSHWGSVNDIYFGDNQTIELGPRPGFWNQNSGEQFLLEVGVSDFSAAPVAVNGDKITFASLDVGDNSRSVLIVGGKGIGQVARITAFDYATNTVTLDRPFAVTPDSTSDIRIGRFADRVAIYNNKFDGRASQVQQQDHVATTAVYWQATTRLTIAANTLTDMRGSFSCWGTMPGDAGTPYNATMPDAWADILGNVSTKPRYGLATIVGDWGQPTGPPRGNVVLAQAWRNNRIVQSAVNAISAQRSGWVGERPIKNLVYEFNSLDAPLPYDIFINDDGSYTPDEIYLRGNTLPPAPANQTLFGNAVPAIPDGADGVSYELGVKFKASVKGKVTAIRYWKPALEGGVHVGRLWKADGTPLGSVTFTGETASGWQQATLATPIILQPNAVYVVTVTCNTHYGATVNALTSPTVYYSLSTVADGNNGVYGPVGQLPTQSYSNSNYFRDIAFTPVP